MDQSEGSIPSDLLIVQSNYLALYTLHSLVAMINDFMQSFVAELINYNI